MKKVRDFLKSDQAPACKYVLCYTVLFAVCALLAFWYFIARGKSLIWCSSGNMDGIAQHYTALSYYGSYLRSIIRTLLTTGRLSIPQFDLSIGMGSDVLTTLHYYVIGDPLALLSALVPRAYTEILYNALVILRLWLAGLSFSLFVGYFKKNDRFYTLIGALAYVFSSYVVLAAVRHPYFANPMIYLPLVLLGAEYIFAGKKPWLFIGMVALCGLSNFYFFYMICILTVLYVLVRMFDFVRERYVRNIAVLLGKFAGFALVGVLLAGVILLPILLTMMGTSRTGDSPYVPILYGPAYYEQYLFAHVSAGGIGYWAYLGHVSVTLISLGLLWLRRGRDKTLKRLWIVCTVLLLVPVCGYVLNGTSYVSNRWCWAYSLLLTATTAFCLGDLVKAGPKRWAALMGLGGLYAAAGIYYVGSSLMFRIGLLSFLSCLVILFWIGSFAPKRRAARWMKSGVLVMTVLGVCGLAWPRYNGYANEFMNAGTALEYHLSAPGAILTNAGESGFFRYESNGSPVFNSAMLTELHSTNCYFSLSSPHWYKLLRSLGHTQTLEAMQYCLEGRTILGTLANVGYYCEETCLRNQFAPYGYGQSAAFVSEQPNLALFSAEAEVDDKTVQYGYYRNENALPFGYTYDSCITEEAYYTMSYGARQQAMLQSAVLETASDKLPVGSPVTDVETPNYTVKLGAGVFRFDGRIVTTKDNAHIDLIPKAASAGRETHVNLFGLKFREFDPMEKAKRDGSWTKMSDQQRSDLKESARKSGHSSTSKVTVTALDVSKSCSLSSKYYSYYNEEDDYSVNIGYHDEKPERIRITFGTAGEYTLERMEIEQIGFEKYSEQVSRLGAESLQNVVFSDNRIDGDITVSTDKLLCLSLPYSDGWTAYVDGAETPIKKTNIGFMGLELSAGSHQITLKYFTSGLKAGLLASGVGAAAVAGLAVFYRISKKRKEKHEKTVSKV